MKIFVFNIAIVLMFFNSFSQNECGTVTPNVDFFEIIDPNFKSTTLNNATIQVFVHVVRKNNGGGSDVISVDEILHGFSQMQNKYAMHNICFVLKGIGYINKTKFYRFTDEHFNSLTNTNLSSDAIDIYIVPNRPAHILGYNGKATGIPGRAFVIQRNAVTNGSTMAHEMGHCLGLYHTHETSFCTEAIDGSNCHICGDLVCDTPADPMLSNNNVNSSCIYIGGGGYNPLTKNIMSYSPPSCRMDFTEGQKDRILNIIPNSSMLMARLAPSDIIISDITIPYSSIPFINISNIDFIAKNSISTSGDVFILSGAKINLLSEYEITLNPGFEINSGAEFCAKIDVTCPPVVDDVLVSNLNKLEDNSVVCNLSDDSINNIYSDEINVFINNLFSVSPNPSNGKLTLLFHPTFELSNAILSIYNDKGKNIYNENITNEIVNIDLNNFSSGVYYVSVSTSDKKTVTKKVIIYK